MASERPNRVYRFDPADTAGVFLGLGVMQCALLGGGLVASVLALTERLPLPLTALPIGVGAAVAFARLGGRPAWEWLPLAASWAWTRLRHGRRWFAPLPLFPRHDRDAPPLPPCLAGLRVVEVPWRGRQQLGAVLDPERHTLTATVRVGGSPFAVQARGDQDHLLAGWGDILNQFAVDRGPVTHVAWCDLAAPSGLHEHRAWLAGRDATYPNADAAASYHDLLNGATATATAHDTIVTLTVARDRAGHAADPDAQLQRMLATSVEALLRGARSADLTAGEPLNAGELHRVLRVRLDPHVSRPRSQGGRLVDRLGLITADNAWPTVLDVAWRHIRVDAAFHRTYHVACWPRLPVGPDWLEGFLAGCGVTRSMTVVFCPVSAHQSRRAIERDLIKLDSDAATKEDKGRRVDARHHRATQSLLDREHELVAGYAEMRYAALVSVCARSPEELDEHGDIVEQLAREAGMELRCLDGRQDVAWAAALPLGLAPATLLF